MATRRAGLIRAGAMVLICCLGTIRAASRPGRTKAALEQLIALSSIPSQSTRAADVRRAADWLRERFEALGLDARLLEPARGVNPLVFAHHEPGHPVSTVLFYMHFDTQPPGSAADWPSTGGEPFSARLLTGRWDDPDTRPLDVDSLDETTLETARLYGRGVADDKAPIVMHLQALRGWLRSGAARRLHVKYLLDSEEEMGSPHIDEVLEQNGGLLSADLLVICDGPMDPVGRPSIYLGARGDMHMKLRVTTAATAAHSGNYGLMPNAAWRLAALLATMKDAAGVVKVAGFLDDVVPPTPAQRAMLAKASIAEATIARHLGVSRFEGDPRVPYFERLLFRPGLVINQLAAGRPGNQIPHVAEALLEVRLVPDQDPRRVFELFQRHVRRSMPDARMEYVDGIAASRMDPLDPRVARGIAAARAASGGDLIVYPNLGGTLPLLVSFTAAGHRYVGLPLVNFDDDQHVANENLRVRLLAEGITFLERFLDRLAAGD
ncbi:MAG: M20/M25/M40 family metallo-hydrolase [Acidobacteriota bacterium]